MNLKLIIRRNTPKSIYKCGLYMVFIYFHAYIYIYIPVRAHLSIFWLRNFKRNAPKAFGPAGPSPKSQSPTHLDASCPFPYILFFYFFFLRKGCQGHMRSMSVCEFYFIFFLLPRTCVGGGNNRRITSTFFRSSSSSTSNRPRSVKKKYKYK